MRYYEMEHRGSLQDALKTKKEITKERYHQIKNKYCFYCYDERINCYRYILRLRRNLIGKYTTWLLVEKEDKGNEN